MKQAASISLKWVYSLVVLSAVLPSGLAASGWVALATGGGVAGGIPFIGPLLFLALGVHRIYSVVKVPGTLSSFRVEGFPLVLRRLGVFALYLGALAAILGWLAGPLMKLLMTQRTESGAEFFVVGMYLSIIGGIGVLGLILFELSRLIGFERQGDVAAKE